MKWTRQRGWSWGLVVLIAVQTLLAVDWLSRDQRPAFWDLSAHSREAIKANHALGRSSPPVRGRLLPDALREAAMRSPATAKLVAGPVAGFANIAEAFYRHDSYPSLSYLVAGLLTLVLGTSPDALAFAFGTFWYVAMIVGTYRLATLLHGRAAGLLAAILASSQPMQLALAREAVVDSAMVAVTIWGFVALVHCDGFRRRGASIGLGVLCGLGMLAKQPFIIVMGPPVAWIALQLVLQRRRDLASAADRVANAGAALMAALLVAGPWYVAYLPAMLLDPIRLGRIGVEVDAGSLAFGWDNLMWYPRALWTSGLGPLQALPSLLGVGWLVWTWRSEPRAGTGVGSIGAGAIGLGLAAAFLFFSLLFPTKHVRYVAQIGPLLAVATALAVAGLRAATLRHVMATGLVVIAAATVWGTTLRTTADPWGLFQSDLLRAPDTRDWAEEGILSALAEHAGSQPEGRLVHLAVLQEGVDYWSPLMVRTLPPLLRHLDGRAGSAIAAVRQLREVPAGQPFYFLAVLQRPLGPQAPYVVWLGEAERALLADRSAFQRVAEWQLPEAVRAELFLHPGLQSATVSHATGGPK